MCRVTDEPQYPTDADPTDADPTDADLAVEDPSVAEQDVVVHADVDEIEQLPKSTVAPAQFFDVASQRDEALTAAVAAIREGRTIVLPTDTVYGIGANAMSAPAVQGLLDAKKRGRDMPPPVLIADAASLGSLVQFIDEDAKALAERFWPGALTLVLRTQEGLRIDLGETRGTIAVRVPDHEFTRALLRRTGPLAVSSANVSGQPSSTDIDGAREQLGDTVAVYLDAGPTPGSTPSTIVDFSVSTLGTLLRAGAISIDELHEVARFIQVEEEPEPASEPVPEADPLTDADEAVESAESAEPGEPGQLVADQTEPANPDPRTPPDA